MILLPLHLLVGLSFLGFSGSALAAPQDYRTTPVPILKQINRQNEDGSYSYGYEAADGSYKVETKYPTGEVFGKYGYVGDDGKVREVEYGASKRGFEPVGTHINVAPPTLTNTVEDDEDDDGQYREDPSIYERESQKTVFSWEGFKTSYQSPQVRYQQPRFYARPSAQTYSQPRFYASQPYYRPVPIVYDPRIFKGHPASNIDLKTGSYTISYTS